MKKLLRGAVGDLVWRRLGQAKQEFFWSRIKDHSAPEIQPFLKQILNFDKGFYVEVGANDGRSFSNTYFLEKSRNWRGILVEPILHKHFESKIIRDNSKNIFIYGACVGQNFKENHIELQYSNLMTSPKTSNHNNQEWAINGLEFLSPGEGVVPIWAPALTLANIFSVTNTSLIHFLSIDVEGGELEVVNGINWSEVLIKVILIETPEESDALKLLLSLGYKHEINLGLNHILTKE
jgi:FkbM family methyltransferase